MRETSSIAGQLGNHTKPWKCIKEEAPWSQKKHQRLISQTIPSRM